MSKDFKLKFYVYFIHVKKTSVVTSFCQMGVNQSFTSM